VNTLEYEEFLQAQKEGTLDTGINLCNMRWCISGVFNGKLSWTDLPNPDDPVEEALREFVNEIDEPDEGMWFEQPDKPLIDDDGTTGLY
jgi:hypothetical protein